MTGVEFAITTLGLVSGISATIGYSVALPAPKVAKACCWLSAISFGLTGCVWASNSDEPMILRRVIGMVSGALAGLALTWAIEQINAMTDNKIPPAPPPPSKPTPSLLVNNQGIVTNNQSGGNNTVNNYEPLRRRLDSAQRSIFQQAANVFCASSKEHIAVTAANSNNEAQVYAMDFGSALKDAGCSADLELPIPGLKPDVTGLIIGVRNNLFVEMKATLRAPSSTLALSEALKAASLHFSWSPLTDEYFPDRPFIFIVGAR